MHAAMTRSAKSGWFERLRRDGRLFALLGFVLVALHSLQPLAVAEAGADGRFVLCTMLGAEPLPDGTPIRHDGCDDCVVGACCPHAVGKAIAASTDAWTSVAALAFASLALAADTLGAPPAPSGPPGIRAPPAVA